MKRFLMVVVAGCALALAFSLAGCSGSAKATDADSLKGFWVLESAETMGFDAAINLDEEDFAECILQDSYLEGTWKADGSEASITFEGAKPVSIYVSDGKLFYGTEDGSRLVFVAGNADEYFDDDDEGLENEDSDVIEVDADELGDFEGIEIVDEKIEDITPVAVADDEVCTIQVVGKGTDFTADPGYKISITNNSNVNIFVVPDGDFKVGGKDCEAGLGEVVEAGETVEAFIYFSADELGGSVEKLKGVEGTISVGDDDSGEELKSYTFKMD